MSALLDRYRIFLTHDGDTREVTPDQDDLVDAFTPEDNQVFFRRRTKNDLALSGADFDWVLAIEQGSARCLPIVVEYKLIIPGAPDEPDFIGYAYLDDASFDIDACSVILKVESEDKYSRLTAIWEREVNFLEGTEKVTCKTRFVESGLTEIQQQDLDLSIPFSVFVSENDFTDDDFEGSAPRADCWVMITDEVNVTGGGTLLTRSARFMREVTIGATAPAGNGWRAVDGGTKYARSVASVLSNEKTVSNPTQFGTLPAVWVIDLYRRYYAWIQIDVPKGYKNGVRLPVVLTKLLSGTGISVKSNVFGINPAGASPSNSVYDNLRYTRLCLYDRSDICLPTASNPATVSIVTLKGILEKIGTLFQVFPVMDGDTLVLEHVSFYDLQNGIDFTATAANALLGKTAYSYDGKETPEGEDWIHEGEDSAQQLFKRWAIYYEMGDPEEFVQNCIKRLAPRRQRFTQGVCNDLGGLLANPDEMGRDGLTFVDSFIDDDVRYLDANDYFTNAYLGAFNASLGPPGLRLMWNYQRYFPYYKWFFPLPTGPSANVGVSDSVIFFKKQVEIEIHLKNILDFDPLLRQKTQFGWGKVQNAEYSRKTGILKLTLLHQ